MTRVFHLLLCLVILCSGVVNSQETVVSKRSLIESIKTGDLEEFKRLLIKNPDVAKEHHVQIFLHTLELRKINFIEAYLSNGGYPNKELFSETTPLELALDYGDYSSANLILKYGGEFSKNSTPLRFFSYGLEKGKASIEYYVGQGGNINQIFKEESFIKFLSSGYNLRKKDDMDELIAQFIKCGAQTNFLNSQGESISDIVYRMGYFNLISYFDNKNKYGEITSLFLKGFNEEVVAEWRVDGNTKVKLSRNPQRILSRKIGQEESFEGAKLIFKKDQTGNLKTDYDNNIFLWYSKKNTLSLVFPANDFYKNFYILKGKLSGNTISLNVSESDAPLLFSIIK